MMVFARYVMFSEVYWHHAVRSGTAMLQRAFFLLHKDLDFDQLFRQSEQAFVQHADAPRIEAVELAHRCDPLAGHFGHG